jgi:putative membrane protein
MMGWESGWHWGWMYFGGLMMLLFWGGLFALVVLALRGFMGGNSSGRNGSGDGQRRDSAQTPLEILQIRYAKGEINREEFERIRHELQAS